MESNLSDCCDHVKRHFIDMFRSFSPTQKPFSLFDWSVLIKCGNGFSFCIPRICIVEFDKEYRYWCKRSSIEEEEKNDDSKKHIINNFSIVTVRSMDTLTLYDGWMDGRLKLFFDSLVKCYLLVTKTNQVLILFNEHYSCNLIQFIRFHTLITGIPTWNCYYHQHIIGHYQFDWIVLQDECVCACGCTTRILSNANCVFDWNNKFISIRCWQKCLWMNCMCLCLWTLTKMPNRTTNAKEAKKNKQTKWQNQMKLFVANKRQQ